MNCKSTIDRLDDLLDNPMPSAGNEQARLHLQTCAECQETFEMHSSVRRTARQMPVITTSAALDQRVLASFRARHVEQEHVSKPRPIGWLTFPRLVFASAFIVVALFIGFGVKTGGFMFGPANTDQAANHNATDPYETAVAPTPDGPQSSAPASVVVQNVPVTSANPSKPVVAKSRVPHRIVRSRSNSKTSIAITSNIKDNEYLTEADLKGFELVSELKPQIIKGNK